MGTLPTTTLALPRKGEKMLFLLNLGARLVLGRVNTMDRLYPCMALLIIILIGIKKYCTEDGRVV